MMFQSQITLVQTLASIEHLIVAKFWILVFPVSQSIASLAQVLWDIGSELQTKHKCNSAGK